MQGVKSYGKEILAERGYVRGKQGKVYMVIAVLCLVISTITL